MIKIPASEIKLGMRIVEIDRPWLETPFLFQGIEVNSIECINQIREHCEFVYVEGKEKRGIARAATTSHEKMSISQLPSDFINFAEEISNNRVAESKILDQYKYKEKCPVEEEFGSAKELHQQASKLIDDMYEDARMGKSIDTGYVKDVLNDLAASVVRNPDASILMTKLRTTGHQESAEHGMNVSCLSMAFGRHLGLPKKKLEELGLGSLLLDIGNTRVPEEILNKETELTNKEFDAIKLHTVHGYEILINSSESFPYPAIEIAYTHHERMDGTGYPRGLRGHDIPLFGRIVAIVDSYIAITSDRHHRIAKGPNVALRELYTDRSGRFDHTLVEQFIQCLGIYPVGTVVKLSSEEVGIIISQNHKRRLRPKILLVSRKSRLYKEPRFIDLSLASYSGLEVSSMLEPEEYQFDIADYIHVELLTQENAKVP